ncbi:MAG: cytochrome c family protein [Planctomycetia bacterium]|nr:cytochrome c family protein [Planctomycetia bacterium]
MKNPGWSMPATVIAVVILLGSVPRGFSAPPDAQPLPPPAFRSKGADLCVKCHRSEQGDWCDVATTSAWRHDAHARAHLALSPANERTHAMEQALGIKAAETASCVACHTHPVAEPPIEEETNLLHAGISCETCHGAGSGYLEPHMEKAWRFLSSSEKQAFGMHDLRNPAAKAQNCLSCHLGEVATDRIITHQMYAAGHPPLPAFEMEAFSAGMGPHWKRVWEKSPRIQRLAAEANYETEGASELERSMVGSLVALRETARLVNDYAHATENDAKDRPWPELALYDCQACHHELAVPSWRQEAGYGRLVPGRPSLVRWPRRLAAVAFEQAGMPTDVDALLDPFVTVLNRRPFGTADGLRQAADAGAESFTQIDRAIAALSRLRRDETLAAREQAASERLAAAGRNVGDFESARMLAWALMHGLAGADAWPQDIRTQKISELSRLLALGFPTPAYPLPPSPEKPFWQTSLAAAPDADIDRVRKAFRLPPTDAPPAPLEVIAPPTPR